MSHDRHAGTRRIKAPAPAIWAIVSDPNGHVAIDGSGMLQVAPDVKPLTEVGQIFPMLMDRTPLNDVSGLVKYSVNNIVTRIEPGRLLEWTVAIPDGATVGHIYGWRLDPVSDDETEVTNSCDWTNIEESFKARTWPIVPIGMLEASVARLEQLATGS